MRHCSMTTVVPISKRGTVTLPPALRRKFGFDQMENPLVIIEERDGEMILRPAAAVPVRDLPKELIEQWIAEDEAGMAEFEMA
jgi:bifunctional DNA-binding transcriptional regulator/antitoxin component of YhaV-PrlF toxin-antitoxin module